MRRRDMVAALRKVGMPIWASHCPGCGRWAHTVAGNNAVSDEWDIWQRTDCKKCGVWEAVEEYIEGTGWVTVKREKL